MLYMDAKDQVLDQDIFTDLYEAERTGSTVACASWRSSIGIAARAQNPNGAAPNGSSSDAIRTCTPCVPSNCQISAK